jgi:hypothetical protein
MAWSGCQPRRARHPRHPLLHLHAREHADFGAAAVADEHHGLGVAQRREARVTTARLNGLLQIDLRGRRRRDGAIEAAGVRESGHGGKGGMGMAGACADRGATPGGSRFAGRRRLSRHLRVTEAPPLRAPRLTALSVSSRMPSQTRSHSATTQPQDARCAAYERYRLLLRRKPGLSSARG